MAEEEGIFKDSSHYTIARVFRRKISLILQILRKIQSTSENAFRFEF
jgi:hypothetical protein